MNSDIDKTKKLLAKQNIIDSLARLTAKITLKYNIPIQEFFDSFKKQLINVGKKQNPEYSMVELSARTGIDRRYIKLHLNDEVSEAKPSKIKLILDQLRQLCRRTNSTFVIKYGASQSFESICNTVAPGSLTASSIAKELIRQGNIVEEEGGYKVIELSYTPDNQNIEEHLRLLIIEMNRLSDTVLYNAGGRADDDKQCQRNIFTTQVHPSNFFKIKTNIAPIIANALDEICEVIVPYEEDVLPETYIDFGVSMFVFGFDKDLNSDK